MSSFPRVLMSLLNIGILIFGVYQILFAENLSEASSFNSCLRQRVSSYQWIGVISSVVAIIGIIGTCFQLKALQFIYLLVFLLSTISTIVFCIFVSAMMPGLPPEQVYYRTADHGVWLPEYGTVMQKTIANGTDFNAAKDCFKDIDTCGIMVNQTEDQKDVYIDDHIDKLHAVELFHNSRGSQPRSLIGCCAPPNRCGLEPTSKGHWVTPIYGLNSTDDECQKWAKEGRNCYDCDSCKAGYLGSYQKQWERSMSSRTQCIAMLIATSALACYTFMRDHYVGDNTKDPKHEKIVRSPV
ncbi:hypothetical protein OROHE_002308 [Orobanche hederae]